MSESFLTSSSDSPELLITENTNSDETFGSYSLLFDKSKHNFSTSSEISFLKHDLSPVDHNQTVTKEFSRTMIDNPPTEELLKFNPFLLLFTQDDQLTTNEIEINLPVHSNQLDGEEIVKYTSPDRNSIIVFHPERLSKRDSFKNRRTCQSSDDDQAFEKFLQEHRASKPIEIEEKSPIQQQRRKKRNSLKDFIRDSSSSPDEEEENPSEFYPKINRIIDKDSSWRKTDDASDESSETSSSSSSSESDHRSTTTKKTLKLSVTFLESLSNYVPLEDKHPDAKQYFIRTGFRHRKKRQELMEKLFSMYNEDVFSSELSNKVTLLWSGRLTATAGHCTTRRSAQTATITLSHKVCDSPERCRDTLLHEMCHAAVSLIDGAANEGHGPLWRKWTRKAERCYPYLPAISVKHTYDIVYKFIYRCVKCQYEVHRHSKSLDVEIDLCGKCLGKFELLLNQNNNQISEEQTPKKPLTKYNLFIKEHFQTMKQAQPHLSTPQLMKHLSQEYRKKIQEQDHLQLPDLEKLQI